MCLQEMKAQGIVEDRLELLKGMSGSFRPGMLTALMSVSGVGKTKLMDVLARRKTGGYIEGNITCHMSCQPFQFSVLGVELLIQL